MNKIVTKQLLMINSQITGNSENISEQKRKALNSAAAAPYELNENYYYIHRTLAAKAAKLGCELTKLQPFKDQNELTALVASLTMLEINGYRLIDYKEDIGELKALFKSNDISGAERWLTAHTIDNNY